MAVSGNPCVLVYDVGGSHISAAACSASDYSLGPVVQAHLPNAQSSAAFVGVLAQLAAQASPANANILGASLAMPGPFDYEAGVSWMRHKMPYLYGVNVGHELALRVGWQDGKVRFLNDAAAFLWGEIGAGAARGVPRAVGITLGTGIGSGFAVDGRVLTEGVGVPPSGEIWNVPFEGGIVEDLISTRAIKQMYRESTGLEREVAEIATGAPRDSAAVEVFRKFGASLGHVLRILLHDFSPQVVVLGGGIAHASHLFLPTAENELEGVARQLRISALGDRAPLIGAGVSWFAKAADTRAASAASTAQV
ncbi:MAG: ROK family protein [Terracidiphilus sp.]